MHRINTTLHQPPMTVFFFFSFLFSPITSRGLWNHRDAHQLLKSRCFRNEENHNGRCFSELLLAVMAALEGIRAAPLQRVSRLPSLSRREHHEGRTWWEAMIAPTTTTTRSGDLPSWSHTCADQLAAAEFHTLTGYHSRDTNSWPRRNMTRTLTFAGGSLLIVFVLRWQFPSPQWCFPVHPRVCVCGK